MYLFGLSPLVLWKQLMRQRALPSSLVSLTFLRSVHIFIDIPGMLFAYGRHGRMLPLV